VLQGPPGTGKTTTICNVIKRLLQLHRKQSKKAGKVFQKQRVLVSTDSNIAVDQVLGGLLKENDSLAMSTIAVPIASPSPSLNFMSPSQATSEYSDPEYRCVKFLDSDYFDGVSRTKPLHLVRIGFPSKVSLQDHTLSAQLEDHPVYKVKSSVLRAEMDRAREDLCKSSGPRIGLRQKALAKSQRKLVQLEHKISREIIRKCDVVCATLVGCGADILQGIYFDAVIVDEATQATEPRVLLALQRLAPNGRLILVGDQKQLPPVVMSESSCNEIVSDQKICQSDNSQADISNIDNKHSSKLKFRLSESLFERLLKRTTLELNTLTMQYRMHPLLREWISAQFYEGRLIDAIPCLRLVGLNNIPAMRSTSSNSGDSTHSNTSTNGLTFNVLNFQNGINAKVSESHAPSSNQLQSPICFFDTGKGEIVNNGLVKATPPGHCHRFYHDRATQQILHNEEVRDQEACGSISNPLEAELVRMCIDLLLESRASADDIGVISPYASQVAAINRKLFGMPKISPSLICDTSTNYKDFKNRSNKLNNKMGKLDSKPSRIATVTSDLRYDGVEVKTVDGFQGREKKFIIFSCVRVNLNINGRAHLGFLTDKRRLNVALTRASQGLIVIGHGATLSRDPTWDSFLRFTKKHKLERAASNLFTKFAFTESDIVAGSDSGLSLISNDFLNHRKSGEFDSLEAIPLEFNSVAPRGSEARTGPRTVLNFRLRKRVVMSRN